MRGGMASNSSAHNVHAGSRPTTRDLSPDAPMGRSGCCTGFLCLGSLKRGKRIVPATRMHHGSNLSPRPWGPHGAPQSGPANQYTSLSPSLLAPPSSPASFQNSAVQSSAQSPCSFPVTSAPSATSQIPLERAQTMFQMGPYAHETALVSPPVFSTFTTAPSTAPFTPPPELATHLTTPSSPDVPFAQLLANSFGQKAAVRLQPAPTYSASPFASPDIFSADDLQAAYQLYPGSPLAHLLSPTSGTGASTPIPDLEISSQFTPFQDLENPVQAVASMFVPGSPLTAPESASSVELEVGPLLSHALNSCSVQDFVNGRKHLSATISSFLASGDHNLGPKLVGYAELREQLIVGVDKEADGCQEMQQARVLSCVTDKDSAEKENNAEVMVELIVGVKEADGCREMKQARVLEHVTDKDSIEKEKNAEVLVELIVGVKEADGCREMKQARVVEYVTDQDSIEKDNSDKVAVESTHQQENDMAQTESPVSDDVSLVQHQQDKNNAQVLVESTTQQENDTAQSESLVSDDVSLVQHQKDKNSAEIMVESTSQQDNDTAESELLVSDDVPLVQHQQDARGNLV